MKKLHLFVSSPSDVAAERTRVDVVVERLNREFEELARIEVFRWEMGFYTADRSFQESIDAGLDHMRGTDIVVCIVWKRVGTELDPKIWRRSDGTAYESGTVLEFELAVAISREQGGIPDAYLFRKTTPITYAAESYEADRLQHELLEAVWKRWTASETGHNAAGFQGFDGPDHFERQLELCLRQWLERKGIVVKTFWDTRLKGSPFRGLAPFQFEHAPVFFGRDGPIANAVAKLRAAEEAGTPLLLVIGASGAGKSSLLRAGLVPRILGPGIIPGIDLWRNALVVPSDNPLLDLVEALFSDRALGHELQRGDFPTPAELMQCVAAGAEIGAVPVRAALDRAARERAEKLQFSTPRQARLLLAVDQIERLFTEGDATRTATFAAMVRELVGQKLATVILVLRSDTYARFQHVPDFVALLEAGGATFNLIRPSDYELEAIVTKPVETCHPALRFEVDARGISLAQRLVADAKGGDALPLLQMTLERLYEAQNLRGDGVLRFEDYTGIDEAVARTADETVANLDPSAAASVSALLTALVGNVAQDATAGFVPEVVAIDRAEFERGRTERSALLDAFIENRLLTNESREGVDRVRPTHDALLRTWPFAKEIIGENAALIRVRRTLEPMVADWVAADAHAKEGHLATSSALLVAAERLLLHSGDDLSESMRDYIDRSLVASTRRQNAELQRQRRVLFGTTLGLVIALILAGVAGWQSIVAHAQRDRAERTVNLATETANGLISDLAEKFRHSGVPAQTIGDILDRARQLQDRLFGGGELSPSLRQSEASALRETSTTLLTLGDTAGALAAAAQARDILQRLVDLNGASDDWQHDLALSYNRIGDALKSQGDFTSALAAHQKSLLILNRLVGKADVKGEWQRDLARAQTSLGEILIAQSDLPGALDVFRDSLKIRKLLVQENPNNTDWQRDLSVSNDTIGDVLKMQGDLSGALSAHLESLSILKALAQKDQTNTEWQSDLAWSDERIGDELAEEGQLTRALSVYYDSIAIRRILVERDPGNTDWKRDLAGDENNVGDTLTALSDVTGAVAAYRDGEEIITSLLTKDPTNPLWQRELSVTDNRIGDALALRGDLKEALATYRNGLAIIRALSSKVPDNTLWQSDIAASNTRIGNVLIDLGDVNGALAAHRDAFEIYESLVSQDQSNAEWKASFGWSANSTCNLLLALGDLKNALEMCEKGTKLREDLALKEPTNTAIKYDLAVSYSSTGDVLIATGHPDKAFATYHKSEALRQELANKAPENTSWQHDLFSFYMHLGAMASQNSRPEEALTAFKNAETAAQSLGNKNLVSDKNGILITQARNKIIELQKTMKDRPAL